MYCPTSPQRSLFAVECLMDPVKRERLERSWAHQFQRHALPLIEEARFARFFDPDNGRPNKSVRLVVGVLVLKEVFDLTDFGALEQLEWNAAWQHALDVTPEEAHTCQKTLHNFRALLLQDGEGAGVFESITARLIDAADLCTSRQRQDSTHIVSNIRILTRLGLFVQTITRFLETLRRTHPALCEEVTGELLGRYLDREGYFADAKSSEAPRRLEQSAMDLYWLVTCFGEHEQVRELESFKLVARLFEEQCVPPRTGPPDKIELQQAPPSTSLQSPADPDATYGHKGKGYEVQLVETCAEENAFQVVTAVSVNGANESDQKQVEEALAQTERTCGAAPSELHADCGYGSGENILAAREHGTELMAPIGSKASSEHAPLGEFQFDSAGDRVEACPMGKVPVAHQPTRGGKAMLAIFQPEQCRGCPQRRRCPVERRGRQVVLKFSRGEVAVARRRLQQETPGFKDRHRIRSGIEATNSELKRNHGLAKLRVRRRPRVALAARLKVLGLNLKRYVRHLADVFETKNQPAPACGC